MLISPPSIPSTGNQEGASRRDGAAREVVDLAAFAPQPRHPERRQPPPPLQALEEVVRAVDLVDLTAARVADDDPRPVDPPGTLALVADQPLGLVLGAEV